VEKTKGNSIMSDVKNNGFVKWLPLISVLIPLFCATLAYTYTVSNDSVNRHEFNQFEKRMEDKFNTIEKRFDNLEIILREIKLDLREIKNSGERKPD
jgi:CHASE1-domain containing sensor protein